MPVLDEWECAGAAADLDDRIGGVRMRRGSAAMGMAYELALGVATVHGQYSGARAVVAGLVCEDCD